MYVQTENGSLQLYSPSRYQKADQNSPDEAPSTKKKQWKKKNDFNVQVCFYRFVNETIAVA